MRTFQHICNSYCQHYSYSQKDRRTRDIITPHTNVSFSPTLCHTLYSYNSHTFPAPSLHTAKSYNVCALWVLCITESSIPPPDGPGTAYAHMPSCPCGPLTVLAWVDLRSTPTVVNNGASVTPTLPLHGVSVLWARGHSISR